MVAVVPLHAVREDWHACPGGLFSVTIAEEPEVFGQTGSVHPEDVAKARLFVQKNHQALMKLWSFEVHSFKDNLVKL